MRGSTGGDKLKIERGSSYSFIGSAVTAAVGVFADSTATAVGPAVRWLAVGADVGASKVPVGRAVVEAEGSDVGGSVLGMGDGA